MMYWTKTPRFLRQVSKNLLWKVNTDKKELFLTFDDGPNESVTSSVLDILDKYNARATFFCVGQNISKNPIIVQRILNEGHTLGNHTNSHLEGWKTKNFTYYRDFLECEKKLPVNGIFRPPYGRINKAQIKALSERTNIVMWDVLSGDFDPSKSPDDCFKIVAEKASAGSVIVFHDSEKASERVLGALPKVLEHFKDYTFSNLNHLIDV